MFLKPVSLGPLSFPQSWMEHSLLSVLPSSWKKEKSMGCVLGSSSVITTYIQTFNAIRMPSLLLPTVSRGLTRYSLTIPPNTTLHVIWKTCSQNLLRRKSLPVLLSTRVKEHRSTALKPSWANVSQLFHQYDIRVEDRLSNLHLSVVLPTPCIQGQGIQGLSTFHSDLEASLNSTI